ncbi:MAG: Arylsulfatase [Phycisphaerae bacterium]|nr:Arylsulfatase [Phycisphaerae bacterium]
MNILLIQSDQQRRDSLGVYGNGLARTPALDRLGREGVVFDEAYCPAPICGPARASLITGLRPLHHGIICNPESGLPGGKDFVGRPVTVAEMLAARGYRCSLSGKWHVGTSLSPAACGFEGIFHPRYGYPDNHPDYLAYLGEIGSTRALSDCVYARRPGGRRGPLMAAIQEGSDDACVEHYVVARSIAAVRSAVDAGRPFFARVDFWGPHEPFIIPRRYAEMFGPGDMPRPASFDDDLAGKPAIQRACQRYWGIQDFNWDDWARLTAMCYGYVTLIDDVVARLLAALGELGVADDTAVFYTTDHGGMMGSHRLADKGPHLYDEICRIPLIARVPGMPGGRRSGAAVYNMDLMPTVLELAGAAAPSGLDAVSLAPVLAGRADSVRDGDEIRVEFHGHQGPYEQRMIRTRIAKYIFNAPDCDELYDLARDPHEMRNLADDPSAADLLADMRQRLRAAMVRDRDPLLRFFTGERLAEAD